MDTVSTSLSHHIGLGFMRHINQLVESYCTPLEHTFARFKLVLCLIFSSISELKQTIRLSNM